MMFSAALLVLVASLLTTLSAEAETSVANFYRNKNIDIYIGFSVGGVYDVNARLLSRFMGRHIPGNPTFVPRQMTGAASLTLANWLYQAAPKDGSAMGTFARDQIQLAWQHQRRGVHLCGTARERRHEV
jgi:tripartite-type tricarboxylate transporter receptor subunit TctC